jgi:hypothetical protein
MKETMIGLLQQRMDKCTTEQWACVGALTAGDAFVITKGKDLALENLSLMLFGLITLATAWGVRVIIERHNIYYKNRAQMVELLKDEKDVPSFLKVHADPHSFNSLSGVIFCVGWVIACWASCFFAL